MKASKRHLEILEKRGKLKGMFAQSRKQPGAKAMRKAVLDGMKKQKDKRDGRQQQDNGERNLEHDAAATPAVADSQVA